MNKYIITCAVKIQYEIEADTQEQAENAALELFYSEIKWTVPSVDTVKIEEEE